jgi:hypothetical protein
MQGLWQLEELETLEAISQDDDTRRLFLRMAQLSQHGRVTPFLRELAADGELDQATKLKLTELAQDSAFLHAVEDYVLRTSEQH